MNFRFLDKFPSVKSWLLKRIGYYSDGLYQFSSDKNFYQAPESTNLKIIIVARCHYSESVESFSSVTKKEIESILKLKRTTDNSTLNKFFVYRNADIDGFSVKTVRLNEDMVRKFGHDKFYIPEVELLFSDVANEVKTVNTLKGTLYCSKICDQIKSSYSTSIISSLDKYMLSVGVSSETSTVNIDSNGFSTYLINQLLNNLASKITDISIFDYKKLFNWHTLHYLYWFPLLGMLITFSTINVYYFFKINHTNSTLSELNSSIKSILVDKNKLDRNHQLILSLNDEFSDHLLVHNQWEIVDFILEQDVSIIRITYENDKLIIRGLADQASEILKKVSEHSQVKAATFEGSVRKSRGKDLFILNISLSV